jgi:two-component system CheB/CheR fusion protein
MAEKRSKDKSTKSLPEAQPTVLPPDTESGGADEETLAAAVSGNLSNGKGEFPIVGIGASAGGLDAFERFFRAMPPDTGMAFVIVQHLDPTHRSLLTELVQKFTSMKVYEVTDGMAVEPNCIYVIPPNHDMAILQQHLHLMEQSRDMRRLPIDFFLRSLAIDQGNKAICIVLSGTGTEGTLGLKAVKERDGMVMVQSPESSQYDGMPRSAISTGLVDYILPPDKMPVQLVAYVRHMTGAREGQFGDVSSHGSDTASKYIPELRQIFILLRGQTGHDFSHYKQNTILRRIQRRMSINRINGLPDYVHLLEENSAEVKILFREFLIEVTDFFRDPGAFAALNEKVIPDLVKRCDSESTVRIWIPGCSTGEEAYSIAMLLRDYMDTTRREVKVQIFASDIDKNAIATARFGAYPDTIIADLPAESFQRFFTREGNVYRVNKSVRDMIVFAPQSVIKDPPFSKLDMISCRNLLIYMKPNLQKRVLRLFQYALKMNGYLFLGSSESVGELTEQFATVDRKWKIFRHTGAPMPYYDSGESIVMGRAPAHNTNIEPAKSKPLGLNGLQDLLQQVLLSEHTPAAAVINANGDALYIHGRTGKYLEPASGMATTNLISMAREGLRLDLASAIYRASTQKQLVRCDNLRVKTNGHTQRVDVIVTPLGGEDGDQGLLAVIFIDLAESRAVSRPSGKEPAGASDLRVTQLEQELQAARGHLRSTIEELEVSNQDLKSANEELQSANEELQSMNEELETSKEELQSVNEELTTVNAELESKLEDLAHVNDDLVNLLASSDIGTIFLDRDLQVVRFTPAATRFVNLIPGDVGRPLSHIVTNFESMNLLHDARIVLDNLTRQEREARTLDGRWCLVRCLPYRTMENVVMGVVIAIVDITDQKRGQEQIRVLTRAIEQAPSMIMITDLQGNIQYVNPRFCAVTGYTAEEVLGKNSRVLRSDEHGPEFFQRMWSTIIAGQEWHGEVRNRKKNGEEYWESLSISPIKSPDGQIVQFVSVGEDSTDTIRQMEGLKRLASVVRDSNDAILLLDFAGRIQAWNRGATILYGWSETEALRMNILDMTPEDHREAFSTLLRNLESGELQKPLVMPRVGKDGRPFETWLTITPLRDPSGKLFGISTTERNIAGGAYPL